MGGAGRWSRAVSSRGSSTRARRSRLWAWATRSRRSAPESRCSTSSWVRHAQETTWAPCSVKAYKEFEAEVYVLNKEEGGRHTPFVTKYSPQFFFRTANITGSIEVKDADLVMPGDNATLKVDLITDVAMQEGDRFTMRESNRTVGTGVISKLIA